jgi:hypothetical protein
VIPGKLKNGAEVDLFRGGSPVSWEKPDVVSAEYPDHRLVGVHVCIIEMESGGESLW